MSGEGEGLQNPELDAKAAAIDSDGAAAAPGAAAPAQGAAPAAPLPLSRELAGLCAMIGTAAGQFLPSVGAVLNPAKCDELGAVLAPVVQKYGLERYFVGFTFREELQALFVVVPVVLAIRAGAAHDLAQYRQAASAEGSPGAPGGEPGASSAASAAPAVPVLRPVPPAEGSA